jgi:hypothetical protein
MLRAFFAGVLVIIAIPAEAEVRTVQSTWPSVIPS